MPRRYLLSIDGGGIRGIIPAVALAKLETTTGRPARETFSFVAGTSTGAIIAAAIAAGIPATRIVELYVDRACEVCHGGYPFEHAAADLHRFDVLDQEASRRDRRGTRPGGSRLVS